MAIGIISIVVIFLRDELYENKISDISSEKNYNIINQETFEFTISIPKSALPDAIYSSEGYEFKENEVIVYQTETTSIYLEKIMLANENDEYLYFMFNCSYNLPDSGTILVPYKKSDKGYNFCISLRSKDLTDEKYTYPEAVSVRGRGPSEQFAFYVSTDACKKAIGTIMIEASCNKLTYEKF